MNALDRPAAGILRTPALTRVSTGLLSAFVILVALSGCGRREPGAPKSAARAESPAIRTYQPASSVQAGRPMTLAEAYPSYKAGADDPELDSVKRGRRLVSRHDRGLDLGGSPSMEDLVQMVATGIDLADGEMLARSAITAHDFSDILWPEFPQSRPAANGSVSSAWFLIRSELVSTWNRAAGEYRGRGLKVVDVKVGPVDEYINFRIHNDMQVTVVDAGGNALPLPLVESVVECRGRFKLYSTRD